MFGFVMLSPLFLAGLATAGIPVIIHLINRRRTNPTPFSTLMFLRLAHQHTARRRRIREFLLLVLRCVLLLLLALTFADPHYAGPLLSARQKGGAACVALILDDSFSMQYQHGTSTSFGLAQAAAKSLVESLPEGSRVAVYFAHGNRSHEMETPSMNLLQARRSIERASPGASGDLLEGALSRVSGLLSEPEVQRVDAFLFSDLQRSAWAPGLGAGGSGSEDVNVVVVDCGAEDMPNAAITSVQAKAAVRGSHQTVEAQAEVAAFGPEHGSYRLALRVREPESEAWTLIAERQVEVPAHGASQVAFVETVPFSGAFVGEVLLNGDALAIDDVRHFCVGSRETPELLLVGDGRGDATDTGLFYLKTALNLKTASFESFSATYSEIPSMRLDDIRAIVAGPPAALSPGAAEALRGFVERGGGLLLFLGPATDAGVFNTGFAGTGLLPFRLDEVRRAEDGERWGWDEIERGHPLFEAFTGVRANELGFIVSSAYYRLEEVPGAGSMRVIARYATGDPAIVESAFGAGRILLSTADCDGLWSNLPLRASFVPILHRAVAYLSALPEAGTADYLAGQPFEFVFPDEAGAVNVAVTTPSGGRMVVVSEHDDQSNRVSIPTADGPGVYAFESDAWEEAWPTRVAVNPDTSESDLARISGRELARIVPGIDVQPASGLTWSKAAVRENGSGIRLWVLLIPLLVFASLVESILASIFGHRKGGEGVRTPLVGGGSRGGPGRA